MYLKNIKYSNKKLFYDVAPPFPLAWVAKINTQLTACVFLSVSAVDVRLLVSSGGSFKVAPRSSLQSDRDK